MKTEPATAETTVRDSLRTWRDKVARENVRYSLYRLKLVRTDGKDAAKIQAEFDKTRRMWG